MVCMDDSADMRKITSLALKNADYDRMEPENGRMS